MASSVETRVPFVHLPLWRSVSSLSHNLRTPGKNTKPILKNLAIKYLPRELVFRRKIGLVLPYNKWYMDENGLGRYLDLLKESSSPIKSIASKNKIDNLVDKFRANNSWELSKTLNKLVNIIFKQQVVWTSKVISRSINESLIKQIWLRGRFEPTTFRL